MCAALLEKAILQGQMVRSWALLSKGVKQCGTLVLVVLLNWLGRAGGVMNIALSTAVCDDAIYSILLQILALSLTANVESASVVALAERRALRLSGKLIPLSSKASA